MKREITLGQLLSVGVTVFIALITGWITINNKVTSQEKEIEALRYRADKTERTLERIEGKVELILITLEKKANRDDARR